MSRFERKTREIQKSLHRRARLRRAYFKMIGEETKGKGKKIAESNEIDEGKEIDMSALSDSENESPNSVVPSIDAKNEEEPVKLTGRQKARKKRAEQYHLQKEKELNIQKAKERRISHKKTMTKTTTRGQPRLGSQMGVLLDKIKKSEK